jgi:hypothetical protein
MSIEALAIGAVASATVSLALPFIINLWNKLRDKFKKRQKNKFIVHLKAKDGTERTITIETSESDVALTQKNIINLIEAVGGEDSVSKFTFK